MTQTGLISFLAAAVTAVLTYFVSPPHPDLCRADLADIHCPVCDPLAGIHRPETEPTCSYSPPSPTPPPSPPSSPPPPRFQSLQAELPLSPALRSYLLPRTSLVLMWETQCVIFTVFLPLCFSLFLLCCLQGDHRPEAKMHRLSHGDVCISTTGGWNHCSGSGGQVSESDTTASESLYSFFPRQYALTVTGIKWNTIPQCKHFSSLILRVEYMCVRACLPVCKCARLSGSRCWPKSQPRNFFPQQIKLLIIS